LPSTQNPVAPPLVRGRGGDSQECLKDCQHSKAMMQFLFSRYCGAL
jgi:hypothetical protein